MVNRNELKEQNTKLNDINFKLSGEIKELKVKASYSESIKAIWELKDRIKELEHRVLINEQQVRFNLMTSINEHT